MPAQMFSEHPRLLDQNWQPYLPGSAEVIWISAKLEQDGRAHTLGSLTTGWWLPSSGSQA